MDSKQIIFITTNNRTSCSRPIINLVDIMYLYEMNLFYFICVNYFKTMKTNDLKTNNIYVNHNILFNEIWFCKHISFFWVSILSVPEHNWCSSMLKVNKCMKTIQPYCGLERGQLAARQSSFSNHFPHKTSSFVW